MKKTKLLLSLDLVIQTLLMLNVLVSAGLAVMDTSLLFWTMFGLIPLGIWQLFSALLLGFRLSDPIRCLYMITATTFCSLPVALSFLSDWLPQRIFSYRLYELESSFFAIMLSISFAAGILYYYYSLTTFNFVKSRH